VGVKKRSLAGHVSEDAYLDLRLSQAQWGVAAMRQAHNHQIGEKKGFEITKINK
jgi:hypothetical protein